MVYLSKEKRALVYTLLEEGYPSRYVANKANISQSTVVRMKQYKDKTSTFNNKQKTGHSRLITGCIERNIV